MWTLIKRELQDQAVYVLAASATAVFIIGTMVYTAVLGMGDANLYFTTILMLVLLGSFCALGTSQMYGDRANRISTFLATLAVTRTQILIARLLAGLIVILLTLVPILITVVILVHLLVPPVAFYGRIIAEAFLMTVLVACACHGAGLHAGWTGSKVRLLGANVLLFSLIVSVYFIKGCDYEGMAVVLLVLVTLVVRTWQKFLSVSL